MTDWFRSWHGAPSDPKWRLIARRASVRPGEVWSVVSFLWDRASQAADRGSISGYDCELIAEVFGYEPDEVERIIAALTDKGVISGDRIAAWEKYQPKREDSSAERVRAFRERSVTQLKRKETQSKRDVTHRNAPETETETEEKEEEKEESLGGASAPTTGFAFVGKVIRLKEADYDRWRKAYPKIHDLPAELTKADDYYSEHPPKDGKWFFLVSRWLAKANGDAASDPQHKRYDWNADPANRGVL